MSTPSSSPMGGWTRRQLLAVLAAALLAIVAGGRGLRHALRVRSTLPHADEEAVAAALPTAAAFAASCCGHLLDGPEVDEVAADLQFAATLHGDLRRTLPVVARYADREAERHEGVPFLASSSATREAILQAVVADPISTRRSAFVSLVSAQERDRRLIRWHALEHLARVYAGAPPAWRRRGYPRWPGVGGDPRDYTRPPQGTPTC